jgi:hypothetical protein
MAQEKDDKTFYFPTVLPSQYIAPLWSAFTSIFLQEKNFI